MISPAYRNQVELLLRILPEIAKEQSLAMKGGTAINLFVRDMPRLSIDIDLTYLPLDERAVALRTIRDTLYRIKGSLDKSVRGVSIETVSQGGSHESKLLCRLREAMVKVEVNTVIRGNLWPVRDMQLAPKVQAQFGMFATASVLSHAELYGGKICAHSIASIQEICSMSNSFWTTRD